MVTTETITVIITVKVRIRNIILRSMIILKLTGTSDDTVNV